MPFNRPTKEQVRAYLIRRRTDRTPPPTPEQIRFDLVWGLTEKEKTRGR